MCLNSLLFKFKLKISSMPHTFLDFAPNRADLNMCHQTRQKILEEIQSPFTEDIFTNIERAPTCLSHYLKAVLRPPFSVLGLPLFLSNQIPETKSFTATHKTGLEGR